MKRGFTLIELLVVIAIIGVLASVVMVSLTSAKQKARDAARISDIRTISLSLELYYNDNARYPCGIYITTTQSNCTVVFAGTYMSKVPTDPNSSVACVDGTQTSCYKYVALSPTTNLPCANAQKYHIGAVLESPNGNSAILQDTDAAANANGYQACTQSISNADFSGLSAAASDTQCNATAGTAQPGGTETCYDVTP